LLWKQKRLVKLLILTNNPDRPSYRQRVDAYLTLLRSRGIDCGVVVFPRGGFCRWKLLRRCSQYDAVFLHKKRLNSFDAFWLRRYAKKVIYDFDDAVMYDDKRPELPSLRRQRDFARTVRLADTVIAGNRYLADHALKFNRNVNILPTGLAIEDYRVAAERAEDGKVVLAWIGSRSTLKYLAEIKPALEEIGSRFDNVTLRIICDEFFDLNNMKVERCQWSENTQVSALMTSNIGLAPLPDNRFTRGKCGFKILQYAAAGLPVVASPVGVNAKYVSDGVTGFHASNISEWIDRIGKLVKDIEMSRNMGRQGHTWVESFDFAVIGSRLADLIKEAI